MIWPTRPTSCFDWWNARWSDQHDRGTLWWLLECTLHDLTNMTVVLCVGWWKVRWSDQHDCSTLCRLMERTLIWKIRPWYFVLTGGTHADLSLIQHSNDCRICFIGSKLISAVCQILISQYINWQIFLLLDQIKCKKQNRKKQKQKQTRNRRSEAHFYPWRPRSTQAPQPDTAALRQWRPQGTIQTFQEQILSNR